MTAPGLRLHPPTAELAEQFLTWRHRPDVTRWFLQQRVDDPEAYVADWAEYDDPDHHRVVAVVDGVMVGQATLGVVDGMHAGRGIATALGRDALSNAFGRLGLRRVQAGCFAANVASWRVLEKLGMRREQHGVKDSFHAELGWIDGYSRPGGRVAALKDADQRSWHCGDRSPRPSWSRCRTGANVRRSRLNDIMSLIGA